MNDPLRSIEQLRQISGKGILFSIWHEHTFQSMYLYRNRGAGALVEHSYHGQVLAALLNRLGTKTFPISNDPRARQTLKETIRFVHYLRESHDGIIAVDGPLGPHHKPKPGVFALAQRTAHIVVPVGVWYEHKFVCWWRWDKYEIPLPFTRAVVLPAAILPVPELIDDVVEEKLKAELTSALNQATESARELGLQC